MTRAGLRVARARLAPDRLEASVQALMWEMLRLGDDAPRLIHAAVRRLEAPPLAQAATNDVAIRAAGRWIAGALLAGFALVAGPSLLRHLRRPDAQPSVSRHNRPDAPVHPPCSDTSRSCGRDRREHTVVGD